MVISSLLDADSLVWAPRRALCAGLPEHTWGSFYKGCCKAQGGRAVHSQPGLTLPCLTASNHARLRQILAEELRNKTATTCQSVKQSAHQIFLKLSQIQV